MHHANNHLLLTPLICVHLPCGAIALLLPLLTVIKLCLWNVLCQAKEQLNLIYAETAANEALLRACPSLSSRPYAPASGWGKFGLLQTIYAFVVRSTPKVPVWTRVDLRNERDVTISLDLLEPSNAKHGKKGKGRISDASPSAVIIIFPGVTGGMARVLVCAL